MVRANYHDFNLCHNVVAGISAAAILHFANKTPIDFHSKKQATNETSAHGSVHSSARTCVEHILDLRKTLRCLGAPMRSLRYMVGDNKSVVDSSMAPNGNMHERRMALLFYRARESVAAGIAH